MARRVCTEDIFITFRKCFEWVVIRAAPRNFSRQRHHLPVGFFNIPFPKNMNIYTTNHSVLSIMQPTPLNVGISLPRATHCSKLLIALLLLLFSKTATSARKKQSRQLLRERAVRLHTPYPAKSIPLRTIPGPRSKGGKDATEKKQLNSEAKRRRKITRQRPIRMVFHTRVRIRSIFSGIASSANNLPIISSLG